MSSRAVSSSDPKETVQAVRSLNVAVTHPLDELTPDEVYSMVLCTPLYQQF